jgi:DNA modification methylase
MPEPITLSPGFADNRPSATLYYGQDVQESLKLLPESSAHTVITSPPYWGLRDYGGGPEQVGLEETPEAYTENLVEVFREVARVLRPDGTLWLNLGDSYAGGGRAGKNPEKHTRGLKAKDLVMVPARVALALQQDGWYLRSFFPWIKANCMPESCRDRPTVAHEYWMLLSKEPKYHYDIDAVRKPHDLSYVQNRTEESFTGAKYEEGRPDRKPSFAKRYSGRPVGNPKGRNRRTTDWWNESRELVVRNLQVNFLTDEEGLPIGIQSTTSPYKGAHFAVFPPELIRPMVLAGCPEGGTVLDPFSGSATTGLVALQERRNYIGIDLQADYLELAKARLEQRPPPSPNPEPDVVGPTTLNLFGVSDG